MRWRFSLAREPRGWCLPPAKSMQRVTMLFFPIGNTRTCFSHRWAVGCRQVGISLGVTAAEVRNGALASVPTARNGQTVGCAPPSPLSVKALGHTTGSKAWYRKVGRNPSRQPPLHPRALTGARPGHSYTVKSPSSFSSSEEGDSSSFGGSLCLGGGGDSWVL